MPCEPPTDPDIGELLPWHSWWTDFRTAPTSRAALEIFLANGVSTLERVGPLSQALHGAASDPEAAEVVEVAERRRYKTYREALRVVADLPGGLLVGLTLSRATDILMVLFSADMYQALRGGRGWSRARCTEFLVDLVTGQLLVPASGVQASGMRTP